MPSGCNSSSFGGALVVIFLSADKLFVITTSNILAVLMLSVLWFLNEFARWFSFLVLVAFVSVYHHPNGCGPILFPLRWPVATGDVFSMIIPLMLIAKSSSLLPNPLFFVTYLKKRYGPDRMRGKLEMTRLEGYGSCDMAQNPDRSCDGGERLDGAVRSDVGRWT